MKWFALGNGLQWLDRQLRVRFSYPLIINEEKICNKMGHRITKQYRSFEREHFCFLEIPAFVLLAFMPETSPKLEIQIVARYNFCLQDGIIFSLDVTTSNRPLYWYIGSQYVIIIIWEESLGTASKSSKMHNYIFCIWDLDMVVVIKSESNGN